MQEWHQLPERCETAPEVAALQQAAQELEDQVRLELASQRRGKWFEWVQTEKEAHGRGLFRWVRQGPAATRVPATVDGAGPGVQGMVGKVDQAWWELWKPGTPQRCNQYPEVDLGFPQRKEWKG